MADHTPGPWTLEEAAHGRIYVQGNDANTARDIAMVYRPGRRETADADARLIAAAPELLEAAKKAEGVLADMKRGEGEDHVLSELHAAISKAEGEDG